MSLFRIVLVTIHVGRGSQAIPLGAACVAAALKHDPRLSDRAAVELVEAFPEESPRELADRIAARGADLVGFSLYLWNRTASIECAALVRARLPNSVLLAGGPDAGANPGGLLGVGGAGGPFDLLAAGEGEGAVTAVVRALADGKEIGDIPGINVAAGRDAGMSAVSFAPLEDVSSLPSPWLTKVIAARKGGGALWELARGCPYACTYCYESKGARKLRRIPEERLARELALFAESGVGSVFVLDPTFNADKERARSVLDHIAKEGAGIHFHFEVRAESLDRGLAKRFAAIDASLQIGLQTARPEISEKVGRKLERGLFASKIGLLNEEGAVFGLDLIYGLPGDDLGGFRGSLDFALSLYPNNLEIFPLAVLPGTTLADEASAFGLDYDRNSPYLVWSSPTFPAKDLSKAGELAAANDLFYNKGRAVPWFNQMLHPLSEKPSFFLEGFSAFMKARNRPDPKDPVGIERLQLEYLDERYESAGLEFLLPAVWDVVRFNGAYARAMAEGMETTIDFNYDPNQVLSPEAADLDAFASLADMRPGRYKVVCGADGPEIVR